MKNGLKINNFYLSFVDMLSGKSWEHMWYLYTLVGIMLIIPFIKKIVDDNENNRLLKYLLILLLIFNSFLPMVSPFFDFGIKLPINSLYIIFIILGYLIGNDWLKINKKISWIIFEVSIALIIIINIIAIRFNIESLKIIAEYNSPIIILLAISVFSIIKNYFETKEIKNKILGKLISNLAKNSFGIYIVHMFWINIMYKILKLNIFNNWVIIEAFVLLLLVVFLSSVTTRIIRLFPIFKKVI